MPGIIYKVILEKYNNKYNIAGITNSRSMMGYIAGSVSSRGTGYNTYIFDYEVENEINDTCYVVYITNNNIDNVRFDQVEIAGNVPQDSDIFIYDNMEDASSKAFEINESISGTGNIAVSKEINLNTLYPTYTQTVSMPDNTGKPIVLYPKTGATEVSIIPTTTVQATTLQELVNQLQPSAFIANFEGIDDNSVNSTTKTYSVKKINDAINDAIIRNVGFTLTQTLSAGDTTLTFTNARITSTSIIRIATSIYGINPRSATQNGNTVTLVFDALSTDLEVSIVVAN